VHHELYMDFFSTVLRSHHLTEDEVVFPLFQKQTDSIPYDLLVSQHEEIDRVHKSIDQQILKYKEDPSDKTTLRELAKLFESMLVLWKEHIAEEEKHFTNEKVGMFFTEAESRRMAHRFTDHGRQHSQPACLILPFILYNLIPKEWKIMESLFPVWLIKLIMSVFWKKKWQPMTAYFTHPPR